MDEHEKGEKQNEQKNDSGEADIMELEVFRQHWRSLNAALSEIRELRGADAPEIDPVEFVKHEVGNLKNQFAELKEMLVAIQQNQQQIQPQQPQQQYQRFQPMQTTVPILPYYSTPNFAPIVPINQ
jgi:hypothetical protein